MALILGLIYYLPRLTKSYMSSSQFSYKSSGVDVKAGEALVDSIKGMVKSTHTPGVLANIGGFGGFFKPDFAAYSNPVLVSSTDGVGTKLKVAFKTGIYNTIGQDLVNHCVNDIAVCGAEPLFFLDYFATGKLDQDVAKKVIEGITIACKENSCALIGGETAEMPDIYANGEFDMAGTIVGIVDQHKVYDGSKVEKGDLVIGIESSGLHTNGYSLARKVLFHHFDVDYFAPELGMTIGEAMLAVHRSYLPHIKELKKNDGVHAFSHITGGGIVGNTKRVVPSDMNLQIDWKSWTMPPLFEMIRELGSVDINDMREAFNLGIGLCVIVAKDAVDSVLSTLGSMGEKPKIIGKIS
jgi:phosphoribosylformylglycinamidine cyclo-ligase